MTHHFLKCGHRQLTSAAADYINLFEEVFAYGKIGWRGGVGGQHCSIADGLN